MTDPAPALALKYSGSFMGPSSEAINASVTQSVSQSVSPETFLSSNISEPTEANELKLGG